DAGGAVRRSSRELIRMKAESESTHRYDEIGRSYTRTRRPEPRIEAIVHAGLADARRIVNIGAGAGSYEPPGRTVVAVEPSPTMIAQRPAGAAPAVRAFAEA